MKAHEFLAEGWHSVAARNFPPQDKVVEFARDEQVHRQLPWFGKWKDLHPEFNVAGLWWRELMPNPEP